MNTEMKRSWLVQRLNPPIGRPNPFAFGGGLQNGGLSHNAMALLSQAFSFDYMGAAEFEFGAVPKALQGMADDAKYLSHSVVTIDLSTVLSDWGDKTVFEGQRDVYTIGRKKHLDEIAQRVTSWACERVEMKEPTRLADALRPSRPDWHRAEGWLELDNGFFAFASREMFEAIAFIFSVEVESAVTR